MSMKATEQLSIKSVKIDSLKLDEANARNHNSRSIESIASSLKEFGQRKPIVVDKNNIVIAGNGTLQAAKSLGWSDISIVTIPDSWSDTKVKAFAIADNRSAELSDWDSETLLDILRELDADGLLLTTGFTEHELSDLEKLWGDLPDLDDLHSEVGGHEPLPDNELTDVKFSLPNDVYELWIEACRLSGEESIIGQVRAIAQIAVEAFDV